VSNQEGRVYRRIDEAENAPRKAQGSAEVDGVVKPQTREKYRVGNARSPAKEGDRSRMKMRDINPDPKYVMYRT